MVSSVRPEGGMHSFRIESNHPTRTKVFMDGVQLKGVKSVSYKSAVNECAIVVIEMYAKTLNYSEDSCIDDTVVFVGPTADA